MDFIFNVSYELFPYVRIYYDSGQYSTIGAICVSYLFCWSFIIAANV